MKLQGQARLDHLESVLMKLYRRRDLTEEQKDAIIDAVNMISWDDAVHIAAPWEERSSLCGNWFRNLVSLEDPRPDGISGCWTCLMAAEWFSSGHAIATTPIGK